ncbi:MAG: carbohydrate ABC transporter permease [Candidatus Limnocylindrales bacterium]
MSRRTRRVVINGIGILVALFFAFPVYWMVNTAFKSPDQFQTYTPVFIPIPTLDNFIKALGQQNLPLLVRNSVFVSASTVLLSLVVGFLAAVTLARVKFRGRGWFLLLVAVAQMAPFEALLIPIFLEIRNGLPGPLSILPVGYNQVPTLILIYFIFTLPFTIWSLRGFVAGIPVDLEEAAMVDGASHFQAFMKVTLPLLAPGLVATSIFCFITAWNEYLYAYTFMSDTTNYTLPVWLVSFQTNFGTDWGATMAASTLFTLPVLIFFLVVQRRMVGGLTTGAVRG